MFSRQSALGGLAAALARRAPDPTALALKGSKEVRFVRLGDANQRPGLHGLRQRQETMAPAKCRALGYLEPLTDLTQGQPVSQRFSLSQPLVAKMQMRKGRTGQCIEGAIAVAAPEPLQVAIASMLDGLPAGAVRAVGTRRRLRLNDIDRRCARFHRRQFVDNHFALGTRQLAQCADHPCQFPRPHFASPGPAPLRYTTSFRLHRLTR